MKDSLQALENIGIEFDAMGMICTNIGNEEFYKKDLHFKEIFKTEYNIIKKDLERLKKLEEKDKKWQELFGCDLCEVLGRELLKEENEKLKQVLDILKEYRHILKYNGIEGTMELGWLKKEQYELLKKYLGKEQDND